MRTSVLLSAAAVALAGCVGPAYKRPALELPASYREQGSAVEWAVASPSDELPKGDWWAAFGDPELDALERQVSAANQTVAQAAAQYRAALELVPLARSAYLPSIQAVPSASRQRLYSPASTLDTFRLPLVASWEPGFWGQFGLATRQAKAAAQESAAALENARLSQQALLAIDYFSLRELDTETSLLDVSTAAYAEALELTKARFARGVAAETDIDQARTQLDATRAQATDVKLRRRQLEHAIAVLAGRTPDALSLSTGALAGAPPSIPTALPARLLERRPDVAAAERSVAAANASVGLARVAYFPQVSVSAAAGFESGATATLLDWPSRFWSAGASAALSLLDFGGIRARSRQAKAAYDAAAAAYRQTVLEALQEVEDNLAALSMLSEEGLQQDSAAAAAETSLRLELDRYKAGIVSYLDVIQSQNIALTNERAAAQVRGRRMAAAVSLIRALGGGWDASRLPFAPRPSK